VLPVIRAMRGLPGQLPWASATVSEGWSSPAGREQFMPVRWEAGTVARATGRGAGSHLMARLAMADGLARVPANVTEVRVGDSLEFRRFSG